MFVCVCVCVCVCCVFLCMKLYVFFVCAHSFVCMCVCMCVWIFCPCVFSCYVCMHLCVRVCVCVCVCKFVTYLFCVLVCSVVMCVCMFVCLQGMQSSFLRSVFISACLSFSSYCIVCKCVRAWKHVITWFSSYAVIVTHIIFVGGFFVQCVYAITTVWVNSRSAT